MHTFYEPFHSRPYIIEWFSTAHRAGLRLDTSIAGSLDTFLHHVGRRPFGGWTLFARSKTKVVWIPMSVYRAMGREEIYEYIDTHEHELPHHPWTKGKHKAVNLSAGVDYVLRYYNAKCNLS